jgi:membrane protein
MLKAFHVPIGWVDLAKRTGREVMADNCPNLAAQLAYYFFLALFPALLFLVALVSFLPIAGLMDAITGTLARVAPQEVIKIVQDQIIQLAHGQHGGLLTIGMLGTIWSMSAGLDAIISTLNEAYDIQEARPWWKVKATALGLTVALSVFVVVSFALVMVGPTLAEKIAAWFYLGPAFVWTWAILRWPVVFCLISAAVAIIYYYAPDAEQDWIWITPGSVVATLLWVCISLGFRFYVVHFSSYNATYGAIAGVIILLVWLYVSSLAVLTGAELNAEIEHASPYGKDPGEKVPGEKKKIGALAERAWNDDTRAGTVQPAIARANCDVDNDLLGTGEPEGAPRHQPVDSRPRVSDWILGGVVLVEAVVVVYMRVRTRLRRLGS